MKIMNFGNDYVHERVLQAKEKESVNYVGNADAQSPSEERAEGEGSAEETTTPGTAKTARKKKEAKEEDKTEAGK